jgi:hypothetical protein
MCARSRAHVCVCPQLNPRQLLNACTDFYANMHISHATRGHLKKVLVIAKSILSVVATLQHLVSGLYLYFAVGSWLAQLTSINKELLLLLLLEILLLFN